MKTILILMILLLGSGARASEEPFNLRLGTPTSGSLVRMWKTSFHKMEKEHITLSFLDIFKNKPKELQIKMVNREVNLDIQPFPGEPFWPTPKMALASGMGDCKAYTIIKFQALEDLGFKELRIIIVHIKGTDEFHAILAVLLDGHWLILDNLQSAVKLDSEVHEYDPVFVIKGDQVYSIK